MNIVVCDIQGFMVDGSFCAKEISFISGMKTSHFIMRPLKNFKYLTSSDRKTVRYLEQRHHGLKYSDGVIDYREVGEVIRSVLKENDIVYVNGHQKCHFLKNHIMDRCLQIIDVENFGWTPPKFVKKTPQCLNHTLNECMCTMNNCDELLRWVCTFLPKVETLVTRHLKCNNED